MERRGFLSFLGAAVGGLFVPDIPKSLIIEPEKMAITVPSKYDIVTLEGITRALQIEFEREFEKRSRFAVSVINRPVRVGYENMEHQLNISWDYQIGENKDVLERFIKPSAARFAEMAAELNMNAFGSLMMPNGGVQAAQCTTSKSSIRCVMAYDIMTDTTPVRFDIIGGRA